MKTNVLHDWERRVFAVPPEEDIVEWAQRAIRLPDSVTNIAGPLNLDWTPYVKEPLRRAAADDVEHVILCWSAQVAKTTAGIAMTLYKMAVRRRPAIVVMPTDPDGHGINTERYQPILEASPELRRLLPGGKKRGMKRGEFEIDGIFAHFGGSRSASFLSSRAKGVINLDECDKYDEWTGKEADPIKLAAERARTYPDRTIWESSTPTTDRKYIWPALLSSTNERYFVPCPHCGTYQALEMGTSEAGTPGVKWPEDIRDPERIQDENLAWYECVRCHRKIEDQHKAEMNLRGVWAPHDAKVSKKGKPSKAPRSRRRSGFRIWAAYSPWVGFAEIAAEFLRCFVGGRVKPSLMMNFRNSWQALPWEQTSQELKTDVIRACHAGYGQRKVPEEARVLVATVDVQEQAGEVYLFFVVRAWGDLGESWLVHFGRLSSWERLAELFRGHYPVIGGGTMKIGYAGVDSGFRTKEVYGVCQVTGAWPIKGSGTVRYQQSMGNVEIAGVEIPLLTIRPDFYKDDLHRRIRERTHWHLPEDLPPEYYDHMAAEQKVQLVHRESGTVRFVWKCVPEGAPNHGFDCEVYQLAIAEYLQLETKKQEKKPKRKVIRNQRNDVF